MRTPKVSTCLLTLVLLAPIAAPARAIDTSWVQVKKAIAETMTPEQLEAYKVRLAENFAAARQASLAKVLGQFTPGDTCAAATYEVGTLPWGPTADTTVGAVDDYDLPPDVAAPTCTAPTSCTGAGPAGSLPRGAIYTETGTAPDRAFKIRTDANCDLTITMDPTGAEDLSLIVYEAACSSNLADCVCVDDTGVGGVAESVVLNAVAGTDYFVVVDGYSTGGTPPGPAGPFTVQIAGAGCQLVTPDSTPPTVEITSPTSAATLAVGNPTIDLGGNAADDVGVTEVTWENTTNATSGTATGTTTWTAAGITLNVGANTIEVTAHDAGGNTATDTITVTREDRTIVDGTAKFRRSTSAWDTSPSGDFVGVSATLTQDHLFEAGWWYRVAGDPAEKFFPVPDSASYIGPSSLLQWADVDARGLFGAQEQSSVIDTTGFTGGPSGYVSQVLIIQNLSAVDPLSIEIFHMADLDLAGAGSDSADFTEFRPLTILDLTDPSGNFGNYLVNPTPIAGSEFAGFLVRPFGATDVGTVLSDAAVTDFDSTTVPFGPGDFTGGFQTSMTIPPSGMGGAVVLMMVNVSGHCNQLTGVFCDGFEWGDESIWSSAQTLLP